MASPLLTVLLTVAALLTAVAISPAVAQAPPPSVTAEGRARNGTPPVPAPFDHDLERIREELSRQGSGIDWQLPEGTPVFRVDIQTKRPGIEAILGDVKALQRGPWATSPYHQQFLDLVTPPEARASFTNSELLQVLATGLAGGLALRGVTTAIRNYVAGSRTREACEAVRTTLVDLNRDRLAAGLEPVYVPEC